MFFKVYFIAFFGFMLVSGFKDFQSNKVFTKRSKFEKLATNSALIKYLESLNRIIDFGGEHENNIDINFYFGLFLTNVNLKRAVLDKYPVLPKKLLAYVKVIIGKTENLLYFFKHRTYQNNNLRINKYKAIFSLFVNAATWINCLPELHVIRFNDTVPYLEKLNTKWILYKENVDDRNAWVPNPHQSDLCLASLASAEEIQIGTLRRCTVLKSCYDMVENGTDFGYALAHRLLFLQQARFARGCNIYSEEDDRQMRLRFCAAAYEEVEYIANHDFEIIDLLLEHVCLCSLEGYAQFLRRSWLTKILSFQTQHGCFSVVRYKSYKTPCSQSTVCKVTKPGDLNIDGYNCNGHTTAVAAGTLAVASRFLMQFY